MVMTTISSMFQIVIPKEVREELTAEGESPGEACRGGSN